MDRPLPGRGRPRLAALAVVTNWLGWMISICVVQWPVYCASIFAVLTILLGLVACAKAGWMAWNLVLRCLYVLVRGWATMSCGLMLTFSMMKLVFTRLLRRRLRLEELKIAGRGTTCFRVP